jgi:hypothetical protein
MVSIATSPLLDEARRLAALTAARVTLGRRRARLVVQPIPEIRREPCQVGAEDSELSQDLSGWQVVTAPLLAIAVALVETVSAHVGQRRVCHGRNTNQCSTTTTERRAWQRS